MSKMLVLVVVLLAVFVGAVIGSFTSFFGLLTIHAAGFLEMVEFGFWPDYLLLIVGLLVGGTISGVWTWRHVPHDL